MTPLCQSSSFSDSHPKALDPQTIAKWLHPQNQTRSGVSDNKPASPVMPETKTNFTHVGSYPSFPPRFSPDFHL
ncbi:hypothetical protein Cob_v000392 [Colletotrichum orbiculare MAFF 240422]|uniref:Uncharacterized protein n=1 Tax=Colletotrichum orbiculare (strain 104-T / ATCC 96160 / CBS 514.97 / LARS 414 / MAFF 240422) TaxID=1213857 RepID=A0A484G6K7_COLOR|nr:hypothetical protein Cob_v000392 [Colletotrichum orbiculare MAFF 240422]